MSESPVSSSLFNEAYHTAYEDVTNYTAEAIATSLQNGGLTFQRGFTIEEAWEQLGCASPYRLHVLWAITFLEQQGYLHFSNGYWIETNRKAYSFGSGMAVHIQPSLDLIDYVASNWLGIIQGRTNAMHVLFGAAGFPLWEQYFNNSHDLYAVHNQWPAEYISECIQSNPSAPDLLELGVGFGSATEALLAEGRLNKLEIGNYVLSDVSASLSNKVRKSLSSNHPSYTLKSCKIDLNIYDKNLEDSFDYLFAVNVVHCARQIVKTLRDLRRYLRPGGTIVLSECMRADYEVRLHQEFIFSLLPNFSLIRNKGNTPPCFGFWSPQDWHKFMEQAGYESVEVRVNEGIRIVGGLVIGRNPL